MMNLLRQMVCFGLCAIAAQVATADTISAAETLLFQTNHLENIDTPVTLTYAFKKVSNVEPGFDDEVQVEVNKINPDRSKVVVLRFLSGSRKLEIPDAGNLEGNPALLGFLEHDIVEMKRLTGGTTNYFRKRIRLALAQAAQVRPMTFTYNGKQVVGQEVKTQPYLDDPLHERFEKYVNKSYVFVVSAQVPGGLYQIRTASSGSAKGAQPEDKTLIEETLTLVKEELDKR